MTTEGREAKAVGDLLASYGFKHKIFGPTSSRNCIYNIYFGTHIDFAGVIQAAFSDHDAQVLHIVSLESLESENPFIIKAFGEVDVQPYGLGYEIFEAMKRFRRRIAQYIYDTGEEQTFEELLYDCVRVAINLRADGFTDDDILGLSCSNRKETCVPYIAALFLGIKVVSFDTSLSVEDRAYLLNQVTPKVFFIEEDILHSVQGSIELAQVELKIVVIGNDANGNFTFEEYLDASDEEVSNFSPIKFESNKETAAILFSSGTTGLPKGICLSHYGILSQGLLLV